MLVGFIYVCFLATIQGCEIFLMVSPSNIIDDSTDMMTIRCSLQQTRVHEKGDNQAYYDYEVHHVLGIVVSRRLEGDEVENIGAVSQFDSLTSKGSENLQVTGDVTFDLRPPYLQLTWNKPGIEQVGFYECEINALDRKGRSVSYTSSVSVYMGNLDNVAFTNGHAKSSDWSYKSDEDIWLDRADPDDNRTKQNSPADEGENINLVTLDTSNTVQQFKDGASIHFEKIMQKSINLSTLRDKILKDLSLDEIIEKLTALNVQYEELIQDIRSVVRLLKTGY